MEWVFPGDFNVGTSYSAVTSAGAGGPNGMSSKKEARDAVFAQRAGAASAIGKNRPVNIATKGIRQSGNHSEVIRQGNPGRKNQPKSK